MAGDWIKLDVTTPDKPEVDLIAAELGIEHDAAIGKLIRFWIWADQQSVSGNAISVTKTLLDRITSQPGFADALLKVGWLQARSGSFAIPHFDRHNGQTAKARALTKKRVEASRVKNCNAASVTKTLPEKRREEINIKKESAGASACPVNVEEAIEYGKPRNFPEAEIRLWYADRDGQGWMKGNGMPIAAWQSDLEGWIIKGHTQGRKPAKLPPAKPSTQSKWTWDK